MQPIARAGIYGSDHAYKNANKKILDTIFDKVIEEG